MQCDIELCLPVKYQITAHRLCIAYSQNEVCNYKQHCHAWREELVLSWSSTTQWSHFSTTMQLLWLLDTRAKSEQQSGIHSPYLRPLWKQQKEVIMHQHEKISTASTLSKLSLSTQQPWPCKPPMLRSSCLARMFPPKHTLFTFRTKVRTVRLSFLATRYSSERQLAVKETKLYKILLTSACGPRLSH